LAANTMLKGRYRIIGRVGQGGFGSVYKAADTQQGRYVAVKEINMGRLKPQEIIEATDAFNREVSALSQLQHPNLPTMYEHFTDPDHWYLIMDFIAGDTLERYLEQAAHGSASPRGIQMHDVLSIGIQLCTVLDYMHKHTPPIIFRDLKPSNVMIAPGQRVYLIDFGIARRFKPGQARDTIAFGSPGYAAPEQYGKAQTTPRSDVYSLGAILHQMLTGVDPADSSFRFLSIRSYQPTLPAELDALITQMTDMEPHNRPANMQRVKEELEHLLKYAGSRGYAAGYQGPAPAYGSKYGSPLYSQQGARPGQLPYMSPGSYQQMPYMPPGGQQQIGSQYYSPSAGGQGQTFYTPSSQGGQTTKPQKGKTRRAVLITAGLMGAAWFFSSALSSHSSDASPDPMATPVSPQSGLPMNLQYQGEFDGHAGAVNGLVWLSVGKQLVASASDDKTIQLWDPQKLEQANPVIYHGHTKAVTCIASTVRGDKLASGSLDKMVRLWDMNGKQTASATFADAIYAVSWEPNESRLAVACANGKVYLCRPKDLHVVLTYSGHTKAVRTVAWSPDGNYIASGGEDYSAQVWSPDYKASANVTYHGHSNTINALSWSPDSKFLATASSDRTVQVWDATFGHTKTLYMGHMTNGTPIANADFSQVAPAVVYTVAWQPTGNFVASGDSNGMLHVWDPMTGTPEVIAPGASSVGLRTVVWSPGSNEIASGGDGQSITVDYLAS
jgi:serine/threonine protein kinase